MAKLHENQYLSDYLNYLKGKDEQTTAHAFETNEVEKFTDIFSKMVIDEEKSQHVFDNPFYNLSDSKSQIN